ncbi:phosphoglycerate mutase-like protein [Mucidula mucida]|nr:phosphoglycerate mutase-like protein [Mucidula mucida]
MLPTLLILTLATTVSAKFNPLHHSGPASPYFDAPSQFGIDVETPENCVVDQAAYILRHGSRFPEPGSLSGWQTLYTKIQNASFTAWGPLSFIGSWVVPVDDVDHQSPSSGAYLSGTGAREAFDLGVDLRKRYGFTRGGDNFTAWSAVQQRCVDTTTFFVRGYLSHGNYVNDTKVNRGTIITLPDSVNTTFADSLTPSASCPAYDDANNGSAISNAYRSLYQERVADRLNLYLDGLVLDPTDIGVMQDLCGFSNEINGDKRWCNLFTEEEWLDYEYAHDLNYYYGSGPGNALSATVGYPWVKAISDIFTAGPGNAISNGSLVTPPLIMGFTHDNNIPPILSALGLWNTSTTGVYPLSKTHRRADRTFRSSYVVAFRGYVALERLTCSAVDVSRPVYHAANVIMAASGEQSTYVRVRVNNAPVPIPACQGGPGATCPLGDFARYLGWI